MNTLRIDCWCARVDSNHWPFAPEANGTRPQVDDNSSGHAELSSLVQVLVQRRCYPPTSLPLAAVSR